MVVTRAHSSFTLLSLSTILYSPNLVALGQVGDFSGCVCNDLILKMRKGKAGNLGIFLPNILVIFSPRKRVVEIM